jgi:hypothetical protein
MKVIIFLLLVGFFFAFCSGKKRVPGNIISIETMHLVLWDVIKADEYIIYQSSKDSSLQKEAETIKLYKRILNSYKITEEGFRKSLNYYQKNPDLLKIVLDSIQKKSDRIYAPPETISTVN